MTMACHGRNDFTKTLVCLALLLLLHVLLLLSLLVFGLVSPLDSIGSSSDGHDCHTGSTGRDWCPELKQCIPPWGQTCPIKSDVEFSGGTTLSCSKGRCAAPQDNKCSWSWAGATLATYYWTDRNGHFTIPGGCAGIKCSGCHLSENDSWLDRWRMYLLDRRDDPLEVAMDAIDLLPWVIVPVCLWRCGMQRSVPRRIRHAIRRRVRPALHQEHL